MARRAFILGGSGQIGQAAALNLLEAGWGVTVTTTAAWVRRTANRFPLRLKSL